MIKHVQRIVALFVILSASSLAVLFALAASRAGSSSRYDATYVGDAIIVAIQAYRTEMNRYPDSLSDLVPKYIARIDPPGWGTGVWAYSAKPEKDEFILAVSEYPGGRSTAFRWSQGVGRWYHDDEN